MAHAAFDTLKFVDTLEEAGIPELQARAMSVAVRKAYESSDVATKQDIADLRKDTKQDIDDLRRDMKQEIANVRYEIDDVRLEIHDLRKDIDAKHESLRKEIKEASLRQIIWLGHVVFLLINTGPLLPKLLHLSGVSFLISSLMKTARRPLGPVMIDLSGCELSRDEQRWLTHPNMGRVILFARNFRDRAQLAALTVQIRSIRHDALIAVDHEGGRVQRFRSDGFTHLPAMRRLGECWDDDAPLAACAATAAGYILASELRASGIDFSFTPVLDLDYGRSTAIGDRAFHANPAIVAALAKHLCHGLALAGMANCGKHFPGHGFVEADSHHAMPVDARALDTLLHDAQPYVWVDLALVAVMPAHVVYSAVDAWPAGFSKIWLRDILRRRLGFSGAILSDDLSMEGARAMGDIVESAQAVLDAGCDMALVCNCPDQTQQVLDRVRHAPSSDSSARLRSLAARGAALSWDALTRQPRYQAARALLNRL